ncbi:rhodanese-like domain-containing protein [Actinotalea ferrariae]|uniref:rhodanese-like domain-containing protein n=1 Tax=Actinotalea ferrariae TaxID=1386098 RepID=UPI001C8B315C|nr:rhodanese-like domain-containing protein [Actinotalea ferrariae]MBX9243816.1 rhodanese-like domain-containing protein [Actinotalea ferrariae]
MPTLISREERVALLERDTVTLIEALPAAHYAAEHLPGAVNVPGALTAADAARVAPDGDRTVVVYCSGPACGRSTVTAAAFSALGYTDVRVYRGGKADWFAAGLPMEHARAAG